MAAVWQEIKTGAWFEPTRLLSYSAILLATYVIASWTAMAHGLVDRNNKPLGIAPLLTRPVADATGTPLGLIAQIVLFVMTIDRTRREPVVPQGNASLVQA